jgi:hypothetical protein
MHSLETDRQGRASIWHSVAAKSTSSRKARVTMPVLQKLFVVAAGSSQIYAILQDK